MGLAVAAASAEAAETQPAPGLTKGDAMAAFGGAVLDCLQSRMIGQMLKDLGDEADLKLKVATPEDRKWAPSWILPDTPVWTTDPLGHLMVLAEPSPERCEIIAMQLPVDSTFQTVAFALQKILPELKPVAVQPGYDPIVYQFEMTTGGARYVVHMEGAEPGMPGHALRFSLLYTYVQRCRASGCAPNTAGPPRAR